MFAPKGYKLVFEDSFEGDALNMDNWEYRGTGAVQCGYFAPSQVKVEDGNLVLTGEYRQEGQFGPGWYAGMVNIKQRFIRGYFETRCICSEAIPKNSLWSAFWLQARHSYNAERSKGGPGGAEIDIFEAFNINGQTAIEQNIHCKGVDGYNSGPGETDHLRVGVFYPENLCTKYHVFGLEWTKEEYIFSIDGKEVSRTSFGNGVSEVDEEVIFSICLPGQCDHEKDDKREFLVDYVKVYQLEE